MQSGEPKDHEISARNDSLEGFFRSLFYAATWRGKLAATAPNWPTASFPHFLPILSVRRVDFGTLSRARFQAPSFDNSHRLACLDCGVKKKLQAGVKKSGFMGPVAGCRRWVLGRRGR